MDIHEIYDCFMKSNPPESVEALGWSSEEAQQTRFKIISEIGIEDMDSVLDVGCGYGDFSYHVGSNYLGIDVRPKAIAIAKEKYKIRNFERGDIFGVKQQYDWVVASGIFCFEDDRWLQSTLDTMQKMFLVCNKGVAVNFLSSIDNNKEKGELKYVSPSYVIDNIIANITKENPAGWPKACKFSIRHDYNMDDFTVYLYK